MPAGIVSFAQNFEDVMLWRALGHVRDGFWIDVGAADPYVDSVTHAFSRRGWHGINVEPRADGHARLVRARSGDINLNLAVGAAAGRMVLHAFEDGGLSTLDRAIAARHRAGGRRAAEVEVEVATLAELCRLHAPGAIHFLKIDVEGAERAVLEGADFAAYRPWIVLVEATRPLTQEENAESWEGLMLAAGYRFAWFDGLNRFYVADEHWDALGPHFRLPPNVFDDFVVAGTLGQASEADRELARTGVPRDPAQQRLRLRALRFLRRKLTLG